MFRVNIVQFSSYNQLMGIKTCNLITSPAQIKWIVHLLRYGQQQISAAMLSALTNECHCTVTAFVTQGT